MFAIYQQPTRFARSSVVSWAGRNGIDRSRRWLTEDAAFREVCERIAQAAAYDGRAPEVDASRRPDGCVVVRSLGVTFTVREV